MNAGVPEREAVPASLTMDAKFMMQFCASKLESLHNIS